MTTTDPTERNPMSELTRLIEAFHERYPDDVELTWRDKPRRAIGTKASVEMIVTDLVSAHVRSRSQA